MVLRDKGEHHTLFSMMCYRVYLIRVHVSMEENLPSLPRMKVVLDSNLVACFAELV